MGSKCPSERPEVPASERLVTPRVLSLCERPELFRGLRSIHADCSPSAQLQSQRLRIGALSFFSPQQCSRRITLSPMSIE